MDSKINLDDLEIQFALQQRPYITIADALDNIYKDLLSQTNLIEQQVAPFDFTKLQTNSNGEVFFKWLIGYGKEKFLYILRNKSIFKKYVEMIYDNSDRMNLDTHYLNVIKNDKNFSEIEFLTGVFHLTYSFNVRIPFNVGNIHKFHTENIQKYRGKINTKFVYHALLRIDQGFDKANLPAIQIEGNQPLYQVDDFFYKTEYIKIKPFITDWCSTIQNIKIDSGFGYNYIYHLYIPIYDDNFLVPLTLRGYLGIFCKDRESLELIEKYFQENYYLIQNDINENYKRGIHYTIVDNFDYEIDKAISQTIEYWVSHIDRLHKWEEIELCEVFRNDTLYWLINNICNVSLNQLLTLQESYISIEPAFVQFLQNKVLSIKIPKELTTSSEIVLNTYLKKRIKEIGNLLEDILLKWKYYADQEKNINYISTAKEKTKSSNISQRFYTCFISYSSNDEEFAKKLHGDLQDNDVRCWFALEDIKIGDKIRYSIDKAINSFDRLLVILSKNSINSEWVENEVCAAFEKEARQKKTILFPIRLDNAVLETNMSWAAQIHRDRHIGNFENWKDKELYKKSFERLLRDLRRNL